MEEKSDYKVSLEKLQPIIGRRLAAIHENNLSTAELLLLTVNLHLAELVRLQSLTTEPEGAKLGEEKTAAPRRGRPKKETP